jgi:uncharacterized protein (TIGR02466 family)
MISKIDLLFPTPVKITNIQNYDFCNKVSNFVLEQIDNEFKINNNKVFTTSEDLQKNNNFNFFADFIKQEVEDFSINSLGLDQDSLELSAIWSNVRKSSTKHHIHQHPNSFVSGIFYANVPETESPGDLFFIDPRPAKNMFHGIFKKNSPISDRMWVYKPQTGILIIFPSWLEHGTDDYFSRGNEDYRISVSFNFILTKFISV